MLLFGYMHYNYDTIRRRHDIHLTSLLIYLRSSSWRARYRKGNYILFYKSTAKWQFWQTNNPAENTLHLFAGDILKIQMYFIYQHRLKYVSAPLQKNYMSRAAIWNIPLQWSKYIEGGSGEKVDILRGDSIDHCETEKKSYEHVSNSEWLPRLSCLKL